MSNIAYVDMVIYMHIAYKSWTALSLLVTGKANKGESYEKVNRYAWIFLGNTIYMWVLHGMMAHGLHWHSY